MIYHLSPTGSTFLTQIQILLLEVVLEEQNLKDDFSELLQGNPMEWII